MTYNKVVDLNNYRAVKEESIGTIDKDLFELTTEEIHRMMSFTNEMPELSINKEEAIKFENGEYHSPIEALLTLVYLANYLGVNANNISAEDLSAAITFIGGIYDTDNPVERNGQYIYKVDKNERAICIDGYNYIMSIM